MTSIMQQDTRLLTMIRNILTHKRNPQHSNSALQWPQELLATHRVDHHIVRVPRASNKISTAHHKVGITLKGNNGKVKGKSKGTFLRKSSIA